MISGDGEADDKEKSLQYLRWRRWTLDRMVNQIILMYWIDASIPSRMPRLLWALHVSRWYQLHSFRSQDPMQDTLLIVTYRTGACYQWGGILTGKWNLDGKGLTRILIERGRRYTDFADNKKKEFGMQLLSCVSVDIIIIIGCIYGATIRDDGFGDVIREILFRALALSTLLPLASNIA